MPDIEYSDKTIHQNDRGPARDQIDIGEVDSITNSSVLPDSPINIREKVQKVVDQIVGGEKFCLNQRSAFWALKCLTVNSFDVSFLTRFLT
jgi:hypothetical protein